jgi:hypothetical protein
MVCQHQAGAPAHAGAFLRPSNPISEPIGLANRTSLNHTPVAFTLAEPDPPSTRCDAPNTEAMVWKYGTTGRRCVSHTHCFRHNVVSHSV